MCSDNSRGKWKSWVAVFRFQGMGKWELWTEEIKDAPPIPKVSLEFSM